MKKIISLLLIFNILSNLFQPLISNAAISQYGLPGVYNSSPFTLNSGNGSALSTDQQGRLIVSPSSSVSTWIVSSSLTAGNIYVPTSSQINLYVSNSGTDSGYCTSSSTPCQTLTYTASKIPQVGGGNYLIKIMATGTYSVGGNLVFGNYLSSRSNAIGSVPGRPISIEIDGASNTSTETILEGVYGSGHCIDASSADLLLTLKHLTVRSCSTGIYADNGNVNLYGVSVNNYSTRAIWSRNNSIIYFGEDTSDNGYVLTGTGNTTYGLHADNNGIFIMDTTDPLTISSSSPGIFLDKGGQLINHSGTSSTLSISGGSSGTGIGAILVRDRAFGFWKGTQLFSDFTSFANAYGYQIAPGGYWKNGGGSVTFNNVNQPIEVWSGGAIINQGTNSYNFVSTTSFAKLDPGAVFDSGSTNLTASTTALNFNTNGIFGYDFRYGQLTATNTWQGLNAFSQIFKPIRTVTSTSAASWSLYDTIMNCDATAGTVTSTLIAASSDLYTNSSTNYTKEFTFSKIDSSANSCILTASSGLIGSTSTKALTVQNESVSVYSDGSNYFFK